MGRGRNRSWGALAVAIGLGLCAAVIAPVKVLAQEPPRPVFIPVPAPPPKPAPSAAAARLAALLAQPLLDLIVDVVIPQIGPQTLAYFQNTPGKGGWAPRPGFAQADLEAEIVSAIQSELRNRFDEVLATAAVEIDAGLQPDELRAIEAFFASPDGRAIWTKLIAFVVSEYDVQTRNLRRPPNRDTVMALLTPQEQDALRAFQQTPAAGKFSAVLRISMKAGLGTLTDDMRTNSEAFEARVASGLCRVATGPPCQGA
jgi:hypothetical protein